MRSKKPPTLGTFRRGKMHRRTLRQLLHDVDEIGSRRDFTIEEDGMEGTKGVISVEGHGFRLTAYFQHDRAIFWLSRPFQDGTESDLFGPCDGLQGLMSLDCLKGSLGLLVEGESPVEHIIAGSSSVEEFEGE